MDNRASLIEPCYPGLSIRQQCALLGVNRSSLYYTPQETDQKTPNLLRLIDEVYTQYPFFGTRQMVSYLKRHYAYSVGRARVRRLYQLLGVEAVCPGPNTSKPHPENKIYPYLLRGVEIIRPDQVWNGHHIPALNQRVGVFSGDYRLV